MITGSRKFSIGNENAVSINGSNKFSFRLDQLTVERYVSRTSADDWTQC